MSESGSTFSRGVTFNLYSVVKKGKWLIFEVFFKYKLQRYSFSWLYFKTSSPYLQQPPQSLTMITACPGLQCGWLPWMVLLFKPTKLFKRLFLIQNEVYYCRKHWIHRCQFTQILQYHSNFAVNSILWIFLKSPLCALFTEIENACCPPDCVIYSSLPRTFFCWSCITWQLRGMLAFWFWTTYKNKPSLLYNNVSLGMH